MPRDADPARMNPTTIDPALDLFAEIDRLKRARRAVILAHYYQDAEIQDLADHLGTRSTSRAPRRPSAMPS
jgi:quinolinate synthase